MLYRHVVALIDVEERGTDRYQVWFDGRKVGNPASRSHAISLVWGILLPFTDIFDEAEDKAVAMVFGSESMQLVEDEDIPQF